MTYRQIIEKIPVRYLEQVLTENLIYKAIAHPADLHMKALFAIWTSYVEPDKKGDGDCIYCLEGILKNWRTLQDHITGYVREQNLIDS